jgi:aminopeptidase-like protein
LNYIQYSYLDRGSDERQFSSPRVNLPIASVMRSKYGTYPEYHTSADNLNLVNGRNLQESANFIYKLLSILDRNTKPKAKIFCEPMLSKRNLRENKFQNTHLSKADKLISDVLAYCDGVSDVIDISQIVESDFDSVNEVIQMLKQQNLIEESLN